MAYSETAAALRRCQAQTKSGQPCRQWAVWGDVRQRCAAHGGRIAGPHIYERTHAPPCHCPAYDWPHRPGGGNCRWPDPPEWRLIAPAGKHAIGYKIVRRLYGQPSSLAGWRHFGHRRHRPQ